MDFSSRRLQHIHFRTVISEMAEICQQTERCHAIIERHMRHYFYIYYSMLSQCPIPLIAWVCMMVCIAMSFGGSAHSYSPSCIWLPLALS